MNRLDSPARLVVVCVFVVFLSVFVACGSSEPSATTHADTVKEVANQAANQALAQQNAERAAFQKSNVDLSAQVKKLRLDTQLAAAEHKKILENKEQEIGESKAKISTLANENASLRKEAEVKETAIKSRDVEIAIKSEQLDIHQKAMERSHADLSNIVKSSADAVAGQRLAVEEISFRDGEIASLRKRVTELEGHGVTVSIFGKQFPQVVANYALMIAVVAALVALLVVFLVCLLYYFSRALAKRYMEQIHEGVEHGPAAAAAFGEFMEKVKLPMFIALISEVAIFIILTIKQFTGPE